MYAVLGIASQRVTPLRCFQMLQQHRNDVNRNHVWTSALAEHCDTTSHTINWSAARVLAKERNATSHLLLESFHMQTTEHTLNRNAGNLPLIYASCLRSVVKRT